MRYIAIGLLVCAVLLSGAVGDHSIAIPPAGTATGQYRSAHPRIGPYPASGDFGKIWNSGTLTTLYASSVTNLDFTNCPTKCNAVDARRVTLAYLAAKDAGHAADVNPQLWLAQLIGLVKMWGDWSATYISDTAATSDGAGHITLSTGNLTTGCGGTCAGQYVIYDGYFYGISATGLTSTTATLTGVTEWTFPAIPAGTVYLRVTNALPTSSGIYWHGVLSDWLNDEIIAAGVPSSDLLRSNHALIQALVTDFTANNYSIYNDQFWIRWGVGNGGGQGIITNAIAAYPDGGATSAADLRQSLDILFHYIHGFLRHTQGAPVEAWGEYDVGGRATYIPTIFAPWAWATHNYPGFFTADNPWLNNYALYWIYHTRPDWMQEKWGDTLGYWSPERSTLCSSGNRFGNTFGAMAEVYGNASVRWFGRVVNGECPGGPPSSATANEPSIWPWGSPDDSSKSVSANVAALPLAHYFPGRDAIIRTGTSESSCQVLVSARDDFWSKDHFDVGHIGIFCNGILLNDSGTYGVGYQAPARILYAQQAIAHNVITVSDPADDYTASFFGTTAYTDSNPSGCTSTSADGRLLPNDGGQRRVGSVYQSWWTVHTCGSGNLHTYPAILAPLDPAGWFRSYDWYHKTNLLAWNQDSSNKWFYIHIDGTRAYNRLASGRDSYTYDPITTPNPNDRTQRVQDWNRGVVVIPHSLSGNEGAYVIVKDEIISTDASFAKRILWHTINAPTVTGSSGSWAFVASRTENATAVYNTGVWPQRFMSASFYPGSALIANGSLSGTYHYQFGGKLSAWALSPDAITISTIGGANHEMDDGTGILSSVGANGTNQVQCMNANTGGCTGTNSDTGLGSVAGEIHPDANSTPFDPGSYRLEETFDTAKLGNYAIHLFFAGKATDPLHSGISAVTLTSASSGTQSETIGVTWTETNSGGTCAWAVTFNKYGAGGTVHNNSGAGCTVAIP